MDRYSITPSSSTIIVVPEVYIFISSKLQKRIGKLCSEVILKWTPVIVSDFVTVYSGIPWLIFDKGKYYFADNQGDAYELRSEEKERIQIMAESLEVMLLLQLLKSTNLPWIPHYIIHTEPDSWHSKLLLEFRMRESWQLVDETREAVNNFV